MSIPNGEPQVTKNVRLTSDLINRVDHELLITGRNRNAEIIALIEEAIIEMKYSAGYSLTDLTELTVQVCDGCSGGDSFQLRLPANLVNVINTDVPGLILGKTDGTASETFSEKFRYLLLRGLATRGIVLPIELGSVNGYVYNDAEIESKFMGIKTGISPTIDKLIEGAKQFNINILNSSGHILLSGESGSGKSFYAGYCKAINQRNFHYLDLGNQTYRNDLKRRVVMFWPNITRYDEKQTLVIDASQNIDSDYLAMFLKLSDKKNVRVVLIAHNENDFDPSVTACITDKFILMSDNNLQRCN